MPLEIHYTCPNCGRVVTWIYDEDEGRITSDMVTGCPGKECTEVHEISAREIDEDRLL